MSFILVAFLEGFKGCILTEKFYLLYLIKVSNALSHMTTSEPLCPPFESSIRSVNPA